MFARLKLKLGLTLSFFGAAVLAQLVGLYALRAEWATVSPLLRSCVFGAAAFQVIMLVCGYFFFVKPILPWVSRAKRFETARRFLESELPKWFALFQHYMPIALQIAQLLFSVRSAARGAGSRPKKRRVKKSNTAKNGLKAV